MRRNLLRVHAVDSDPGERVGRDDHGRTGESSRDNTLVYPAKTYQRELVKPQMPRGLRLPQCEEQNIWQSMKGISTWHAANNIAYVRELTSAGEPVRPNSSPRSFLTIDQSGIRGVQRRASTRSES